MSINAQLKQRNQDLCELCNVDTAAEEAGRFEPGNISEAELQLI